MLFNYGGEETTVSLEEIKDAPECSDASCTAESVGFEFTHYSKNVDFMRVQGIVHFAVFSSVFNGLNNVHLLYSTNEK